MKHLLCWLFAAFAAVSVHAASLVVAWDAVTGATGYAVERAPGINPPDSTFVEINRVTTTSYTDLNLPAGTTYSYRVRAFNATTVSTYSNVASGATPAILLPPGNVKVTNPPAFTTFMKLGDKFTVIASTNKTKPGAKTINVAPGSYADFVTLQ